MNTANANYVVGANSRYDAHKFIKTLKICVLIRNTTNDLKEVDYH